MNRLFPNASKSFTALNPSILDRPKAEFTEADRRAAGELCDMASFKGAEKELQKLCEHELTRRNIPFLHLSFKAREKVGWPDLCFCRQDGRFCGIELKAANGKVSEAQAQTIERIRQLGGVGEVVRSYEQFRKILEDRT
jgi:hypothetical protein